MRKKKFIKEYAKLLQMLEYLDERLQKRGIDPKSVSIKEKYDTIKVINSIQGNWIRAVKLYGGWLAALAGIIYALWKTQS